MTKFKVGDIITGNDRHYGITNSDAIMKVIRVSGNEMEVKVINHKTRKDRIGTVYPVDAQYFKLHKEPKPKKAKPKANNKLLICDNCDKEIEGNGHEHDGNAYCDDCFHKLYVECHNCNETMDRDYAMFGCDGKAYCENCHEDTFIFCHECGETVFKVDALYSEEHGEWYCEMCYNETHTYCGGCGEYYPNDYCHYSDRDGCSYCERCFSERGEDINFFDNEETLLTTEQLQTINAFGVELECLATNDNHYLEDTKSVKYFQATRDGSLSSGGVEYVSVPLSFDKTGFGILKSFLTELEKGHETDNSCGCHIHFNLLPYAKAREDSINKSVNLAKRILVGYKNIEKFMLDTMPRYRRDSQYAGAFKNYYKADNSDITGKKGWAWINQFYNQVGHYKRKEQLPMVKCHHKRYCWINAHALFFKNTLEIRLLNGTLDYRVIRNWATINRKVIHYLATNTIKEAKSFDKFTLFKILNKTERNFLLKRIMEHN